MGLVGGQIGDGQADVWLVVHRASTFTRVNGSVSFLCNKRLQKWPTV